MRVTGFRSPRFDLPPHGDLARYRDELAEAGYEYVSDARHLGAGSPVREAPVMSWRGVRLGGGSYQRLLPFGGGVGGGPIEPRDRRLLLPLLRLRRDDPGSERDPLAGRCEASSRPGAYRAYVHAACPPIRERDL